MQILDKPPEKMEELSESEKLICSYCREKPAEIFQVTGDFCLECWQAVTHTNA
jgi:hypothetical protein